VAWDCIIKINGKKKKAHKITILLTQTHHTDIPCRTGIIKINGKEKHTKITILHNRITLTSYPCKGGGTA
jgi:hypothetical protein